MAFQVISISDSAAAHARKNLTSLQYGHPAYVEVATGTGPCRSCLRTFAVGQEERILFTSSRSKVSTSIRLLAPFSFIAQLALLSAMWDFPRA
jgi:hypothetical protein